MATLLRVAFASREIPADRHLRPQPRPEYPRPQLVRHDWLNLNGEWQFSLGRAGDTAPAFDRTILVPFAPEAPLSGIGETGFMETVWYRRTVRIPESWAGRCVLLHVQACDYDATVWVDGTLVGRHRGGFTPFEVDLTAAIGDRRDVELTIRADDSPTGVQARGKQSQRPGNYAAFYTRTTGLWQTVWLEPVDRVHVRRPRITPDVDGRAFEVDVPLSVREAGALVHVEILDDAGTVAEATVGASGRTTPRLRLTLPADRVRLWEPGHPFLYRVGIDVAVAGVIVDRVESYAGLRSVGIDGHRVLINGQPLFQRLVLDQGFYPDGLMTAPSDEALVDDIRLAMAAGFNGARLHQKVFEERFLYHADRLGYLVWGEFGDWGANQDDVVGRQEPTTSFVTQWLEAVERDYSHPSVVGWCPLNETFEPLTATLSQLDDVEGALYRATKLADGTRPVIDASGFAHRIAGADVYDSHLYEQDPERFRRLMDAILVGRPYVNTAGDGTAWSVPYAGQPYFCSEFGGIWWADGEREGDDSWGYGDPPASRDAWFARFTGLVTALLENPLMFGYCFTQLTDVFQEKNGLLCFDRRPKFPLEELAAIQRRPAAYESSARSTIPVPATIKGD